MSEEQRCGTCKHWNTPEQSWGPGVRVSDDVRRQVSATEADRLAQEAESKFRLCYGVPLGANADAEVLPLAFTQDGSDYQADLWTQAEFGCRLWESRP